MIMKTPFEGYLIIRFNDDTERFNFLTKYQEFDDELELNTLYLFNEDECTTRTIDQTMINDYMKECYRMHESVLLFNECLSNSCNNFKSMYRYLEPPKFPDIRIVNVTEPFAELMRAHDSYSPIHQSLPDGVVRYLQSPKFRLGRPVIYTTKRENIYTFKEFELLCNRRSSHPVDLTKVKELYDKLYKEYLEELPEKYSIEEPNNIIPSNSVYITKIYPVNIYNIHKAREFADFIWYYYDIDIEDPEEFVLDFISKVKTETEYFIIINSRIDDERDVDIFIKRKEASITTRKQ